MAVAQPIRTPEEAGQDMAGPRKPRPARVPDGDTIGPTIRFNQGPVKPFPQVYQAEGNLAERWHSNYNHVPGLPLGLRLTIITLPFIGVAGLAYLLQWLGAL